MKISTILFVITSFLVGGSLSAQLNMDSLNKLKDSGSNKESGGLMDKVNSLKGNAANPPKDNPNLEKVNALKEATSKNERKKDYFTGGEKMGVAQTVLDLKDDPAPQDKKILMFSGGLDDKYTVFNGNKEFAIYRMNSLPP